MLNAKQKKLAVYPPLLNNSFADLTGQARLNERTQRGKPG